MKVLFLSLPTGHGHNMCAKAAMETLQQNQIESQILDIAEYINPLYSKIISRGFLLSAKTGKLYENIYRFTELKDPSPEISAVRIISTLLPLKLRTYLKEYAPDVIICTHVIAALIITELKKISRDITAKTYGIITDFTVHPFWEDTDLDYYVLPHEFLSNQFTKKGLDKVKILPFGIPIYKKFSTKISGKDARQKLGLEDEKTILIMGGSMGFGGGDKIIQSIDKIESDFQIIIVCGNNKSLHRKINHLKTTKRVYNYGFVDNIDTIMDASDCIITKPGGLTTSEALAKGLFIIMNKVFPGQEERNSDFLLANGLAMRTTKAFPIDECVYHFLNNEPRRMAVKSLAVAIAKPNASDDLCTHIMDNQN